MSTKKAVILERIRTLQEKRIAEHALMLERRLQRELERRQEKIQLDCPEVDGSACE
jgi:hypothetical protein